jgi:hypothetical protein
MTEIVHNNKASEYPKFSRLILRVHSCQLQLCTCPIDSSSHLVPCTVDIYGWLFRLPCLESFTSYSIQKKRPKKASSRDYRSFSTLTSSTKSSSNGGNTSGASSFPYSAYAEEEPHMYDGLRQRQHRRAVTNHVNTCKEIFLDKNGKNVNVQIYIYLVKK